MPNIELLGKKGGSERSGILTLRETWLCETLDDALELVSSNQKRGVLLQEKGDFDQQEDARYEVVLEFAGMVSDPPPDKIEVSLQGSSEQLPFPKHPRFRELVKKFGWDSDAAKFPEGSLPAGGIGSGLSSGSAPLAASPVGGESSWMSFGGSISIRYARRQLPSRVFEKIGTIQTPPRLPSDFKFVDRNFLKLMPVTTRRGNAWDIEERFLMSGPIPYVEDVYGQSQLVSR